MHVDRAVHAIVTFVADCYDRERVQPPEQLEMVSCCLVVSVMREDDAALKQRLCAGRSRRDGRRVPYFAGTDPREELREKRQPPDLTSVKKSEYRGSTTSAPIATTRSVPTGTARRSAVRRPRA